MIIEGIPEGDGAVMAPAVAQPARVAAPAGDAAAPGGVDAAQRADQHFLRGKALLKEGKKEAALAEYRAAWALKKTYDIAGNLGSLEIDLGMYRDAAEHLSFAVRHYATTGTTAQQLERAKQRLAEARKHVAAVTVTVSVDGAEVLVDGVSVGRAPLENEVFVEPGARVIEARLAGHTPAKAEAQAEKGGSMSVTLTLTPLPVAGDAGPSAPTVSPARGGKRGVNVGGPRAGEEGSSGVGVKQVVVISGAAAAGAGLIAGVIFALVANGKAGDAEDQTEALAAAHGPRACTGPGAPAECGEIQDALAAKDTFSNLALWTLVGAGAVGIGTAIYAWKAPDGNTAASTRARAWVAPGAGGVSLRAAW
jgi:hypothetical protein